MDRAYEALRDAEFTLEWLEDCKNKRQFRILFVAALTLLRTVGQVLVSNDVDLAVKRAAREIFAEHKAHREDHKIYFDFVDRERGLIVHEYSISLEEYDWDVIVTDGKRAKQFNLGDCYSPLAEDETFDGADVRDLIKEVIDWWKVQLAAIAAKVEL